MHEREEQRERERESSADFALSIEYGARSHNLKITT